MDIVENADLGQSGLFQYLPGKSCKWKAPTADCRSEFTTVAFHWKCPVAPNWSTRFDTWRNVEKSMNSQWTQSNALGIKLVVYPGHNVNKNCMFIKILTQYLSYSSTHRMNPIQMSSSSISVISNCRHRLSNHTNSMK